MSEREREIEIEIAGQRERERARDRQSASLATVNLQWYVPIRTQHAQRAASRDTLIRLKLIV